MAILALWAIAPVGAAEAAEIKLRPECRPSGQVVTLGDLAEVQSSDPAEAGALAALELFPAPPPGQRRFVDARQVQDLLLLRAVDLFEHRFTGARQVAISSPSASGLSSTAGLRSAAAAPASAAVAGEPTVVVAARGLGRGSVVGPNDVRLQPLGPADELADGFATIEEVLGQEATQTIPAGAIVLRESLRLPRLVRRGEIVTVVARSPGVCLRSTARARDEGGLGDLVALESLENRKPFLGRVSGPQEVEVYGRAIRSGPAGGGTF